MRLCINAGLAASMLLAISACASGGSPKPASSAPNASAAAAPNAAPTGGRVTKQTVYVAATPQTIRLELQNGLGKAKDVNAFILNVSSVPIVVTSVTVMYCQNLKQNCGRNDRKIKIGPGQRRAILRLEPENLAVGMSYRLGFTWHAEGATKSAMGALADAGDSAAAVRVAAINHAEEIRSGDALYKDKLLLSADMRKLGDMIAELRADPATVEMPLGSVMFVPQLRVLAVDKNGKVLGRVRTAFTWRVQGSTAVRFAPPDTLRALAPGSTTVTMRLSVGVDSVMAARLAPATFTIVAK